MLTSQTDGDRKPRGGFGLDFPVVTRCSLQLLPGGEPILWSSPLGQLLPIMLGRSRNATYVDDRLDEDRKQLEQVLVRRRPSGALASMLCTRIDASVMLNQSIICNAKNSLPMSQTACTPAMAASLEFSLRNVLTASLRGAAVRSSSG